MDPAVIQLILQLGIQAVEYHGKKKLAEQNAEETLKAIAAATAAFRPEPSAQAIAEGAAAAGGGEA